MFFYIKFKYPPITQRRLRLSILLLSLRPFLSTSPLASDPYPKAGPHRDPLAAYMAILPLNSWQFYHFSSGCAATSKPKTYMLIPHLTSLTSMP